MTRHFILLTLLPVAAAAADQPALPAELTVTQALDIALQNSTNIRAAMAQLDQTSARNDQTKSPLLPQIDIRAHQNYQTVNLIGIGIPIPNAQGLIGPFSSMDARVFLSQQILNISEWRSWKSATKRVDSSRLLVDNAKELIALRVLAAYLDALKAKESRNTLAQQKKLAEDLYNLTRERVTQGVAAELDANRAMQQVNTLEQQRLEAEQAYVAAKLNLANILQARITSEFEVSDNAAYGTGTAPDRDSTVKAALAARADYKSAEATVQAADLHLKSIKASRLPTLTLNFDDGQSGTTPVHNLNTYRVQGAIEFPVFTGGRIKGETDEATGSLHEAQIALDENRSQIETDVLAAISGVEWALKELETSEGNVRLSRQEVDFTRARFSQGIVDNTEVVNAQDRLSRADDAHIRAQYRLGLSRANLARATGVAERTYRK
jgi:outer membrane protein TolC